MLKTLRLRRFTRILTPAFVTTVYAISALAQTPALPQTQQSVTVTPDRGLIGVADDSTNTTVVTQEQLTAAPGLTLDDSLHQVAGFQLFRRSSSWTANPTTEGISLRGLGSTAASRTLVVSDQVPLNDPFGSWIHWDEIPAPAIDSITVLRGGAADLYGSSAIGGVIEIIPAKPAKNTIHVTADVAGATENTGNGTLLLSTNSYAGAAFGALTVLSTGGYIPIAPAARGSVDIPANVTSEAARVEVRTPDHFARILSTAFLRSNLLNETRDNGTALQTNGTRLWRYQSGADFGSPGSTAAVIRVFGSRETYRQAFSLIQGGAARTAETLTKLQQVPTDEFGASLQLTQVVTRQSPAAVGIDLRDVRATDNETTTATHGTLSTSAHQRDIGGYLVAATRVAHTEFTASLRIDSFRTFDGLLTSSADVTHTQLPAISEIFANPHAGITQYLGHSTAVYASGFRAFRGASLNELYRTGQVGQQTTLANNSLLSERATGFEAGGNASFLRDNVQLHGDVFWTEVNRPISAVLLSQTATTQTLQRQNLGQIRSRGVEINAQSRSRHNFSAGFGYQLAIGTVTAFNSSSSAQANLTGNWIPEVPRESATASVQYAWERVLNAHLFASYEGREFDDAANTLVLHPYARFDVSVDRILTRSLSFFAASQNILNRAIDSGKTPTPTLAAPRLVQAGLRYTFSR